LADHEFFPSQVEAQKSGASYHAKLDFLRKLEGEEIQPNGAVWKQMQAVENARQLTSRLSVHLGHRVPGWSRASIPWLVEVLHQHEITARLI
jgi:hypothetical protein